MNPIAQLDDAAREARIGELTQQVIELGMCERSKALFQEIRELVAARSDEQVRKMEEVRGLL